MLIALSIRNFALIEKLDIDFATGFSIITGETGAGKSIVLGALGLILGKRADVNSLKNKEEKCVVEARFDITSYKLQSFFQENDLDFEDETIIRREILASGKSRAFINDSPVALQELQSLGEHLLDIHSQQQTRELSETPFQFQVLDTLANNHELLEEYTAALKNHKAIKDQLIDLNERLQNALKEQDYNSYLLEELLQAKLKSGEQETLETEYEQLHNVEFIREHLEKAIGLSTNETVGISTQLNELKPIVQKIAPYSQNYEVALERISSICIEFEDIVNELLDAAEKLTADPERLNQINDKLQTLYNLQKKHQVDSIDKLLVIQNDLDAKVVSVTELETAISQTQLQEKESSIQLSNLASKISANRKKSSPLLENQLTVILAELGMPNSRFNIQLTDSTTFLSNGKDELAFLFSANKGADFGAMKKVASGGELSRIMLAVKSILSEKSNLPTIIFDEIDTGVSGEIANKMGDIMKKMSQNMQVFSITHLPQIAAKGNTHYKVAKKTIDNQTFSELRLLNSDERILEIAQMLSGTSVSESALNHAKSLLN